LPNRGAEFGDPNYHIKLIEGDDDTIYDSLCTLTSVSNGIDSVSGKKVAVGTPSWFVSTVRLQNPLL